MTTAPEENTLTLAKLRQLVSSARGTQTQDEPDIEVEEYDWIKPHHFSPDQLGAFDIFARKMESHIASTFETLCHGGFELNIASHEQHLATRLSTDILENMPNHYFLPFNTVGCPPGGFMSMAPATAVSLVGYMLRDVEFNTDPDRQLSNLEESILLDIVSAIIDSAQKAFIQAGGPVMDGISQFIKGEWPLTPAQMDDMFCINIQITDERDSIELVLTVPATAMEPVLGVKQTREVIEPDKMPNYIMDNIKSASVEVQARLTHTLMSLNDIMNLEPGDVVTLKKKTNEPMDVLLNNRQCFKAYPATTSGKYSIMITERDDDVSSVINE